VIKLGSLTLAINRFRVLKRVQGESRTRKHQTLDLAALPFCLLGQAPSRRWLHTRKARDFQPEPCALTVGWPRQLLWQSSNVLPQASKSLTGSWIRWDSNPGPGLSRHADLETCRYQPDPL
jgi:hypothetical protein